MKQTTKRILCFVLSMCMLFSVMSVFSFAENNFEENDEYYNRIVNDSVIVNPQWSKVAEGESISFVYRGKTIEETYDSNIHFSSIQAAYQHCVEMNVKSPVIILSPGTHTEKVTITGSVTILGANAGINPNVIDESSSEGTPWSANTDRGMESMLRGYIDVSKKVNSNIEIILDGVSLNKGFAYIDAGNKKATSSAVLKNSVINGAGSATYGATSVSNVFYFASATASTNNVKIQNVRCSNMKSSSITGAGVTNLEITSLYYTNSSFPAIMSGDGPVDQNPSFSIKDSMFYNNKSQTGILSFDNSIKDSSTRSDSYVEIANCTFSDDMSIELDATALAVSPISFVVTSGKNRLNIHDNVFIGAGDYTAPLVAYSYTTAALTGAFSNSINVNNNKFLGYYVLNDTAGANDATRINYTGNFFADSNGNQADPYYPSNASKKNLQIDYFWLNRDMTISSERFHVTSTGITNSQIDNVSNIIKLTLEYGKKYALNLVAKDSSTSYVIYDQTFKNQVAEIDTTKLLSGEAKNTYYAVGTSTSTDNPTDYQNIYSLVITTYNPALSAEFDTKDTYMLSPEVASMAAGTVYFKTWDGMSYKFIVGKNVFATAPEIIAACNGVPTILIPAGVHSQQINLTGSAVVMGAKHGINPNIPQFSNPDVAWKQNPDRSQRDQETILEGCAIVIAPDVVNATVVVDGITFGSVSGFVDRGENLETYTTSIIKNVIISSAGGTVWSYNGKGDSLTTVLSFGGGAETYSKNHKDVRLVNLRMVNQGAASLIGDYYETLIMDGVYVAKNTTTLNKNEWTHPKGQNFYLEMRNSCFFNNSTSNYYFLVNNSANDSDATTSNRVVLDNNIFFSTSTNANGIFGIRFCGPKDSIRFVNNTFITDNAASLMPGNSNWFLGKSGVTTAADINKAVAVNDAYIRFNRFIKCTTQIDMEFCSTETVWDYSYNYFSATYNKANTGAVMTSRPTQIAHAKCNYYYTDFNMTTLKGIDNAPPHDSFVKELSFSINGSGILNESAKTYTDSVNASTDTYDFGIQLDSKQAKYGIYSDPECTLKLQEPIHVAGGENVYYIKFSSYDGTVSKVYTATITKPLGTQANVITFGSWRVSDKAVYTCVPVGETTFELPEISVSNGAKYAIYNDKACKDAFTKSSITGISQVPVIKYISVTSEDGKTSKLYTFSVIQGTNDQAELSYIENASKISDTEFRAQIAADKSSFELVPYYSENSEITVYDNGQEIIPTINGTYPIDSISTSKTVSIEVKSYSGNTKTFTLNITLDTSSCDVTSVFGMINNTSDYNTFETRTNGVSFKVIPYLINSAATYAVYSDKACTTAYSNNVIALSSATTTAYLKVVSPDGNNSKVYKLVVYSSATNFAPVDPVDPNPPVEESAYYTVDNATLVSTGVYHVKAADNLSSFDLKLSVSNPDYVTTSFRAFSDAAYSVAIADERTVATSVPIPIYAKTTTVYLKVWVKNATASVQSDLIKVVIESNRPAATYADNDSMASWSSNQIKFLNDNGFGYFTGDNGNFRPKDGITRFEVAAIAIRLLGVDPSLYSNIILPFNDSIPNWAINYVKACYKLGIMNGQTISQFNGSNMTTRQEFAKIIVGALVSISGESTDAVTLYNANKNEIDSKYNSYGFADENLISEWAKPYIRLAVAKYGLIGGSADNGKLNVNPLKTISRQEVAVILANYSGYKAK